jgi:hypothetical protein
LGALRARRCLSGDDGSAGHHYEERRETKPAEHMRAHENTVDAGSTTPDYSVGQRPPDAVVLGNWCEFWAPAVRRYT